MGKVDHCHVAIYLGAGVPKARCGDRTRHQLGLEIRAQNGPGLPHGSLASDDEMGQPYRFRRLAASGERHLLAVPSNTAILDLPTDPPVSSGLEHRFQRPWQNLAAWSQALEAEVWQRIDVRDGNKRPLVVKVVKRRVVTHRRQ